MLVPIQTNTTSVFPLTQFTLAPAIPFQEPPMENESGRMLPIFETLKTCEESLDETKKRLDLFKRNVYANTAVKQDGWSFFRSTFAFISGLISGPVLVVLYEGYQKICNSRQIKCNLPCDRQPHQTSALI